MPWKISGCAPDLVKNDVVKKDVYNAKIKDIEDNIRDITNLATNTTINANINEIKNKILSITNLVTNVSLKIIKVKNKIPNTNNLATTTALTAVENKIPGHSKNITDPEFDKLLAEIVTERLKEANLMLLQENVTARLKEENLTAKGDITDFVKKINFNDKRKNLNKRFTPNKSKQ